VAKTSVLTDGRADIANLASTPLQHCIGTSPGPRMRRAQRPLNGPSSDPLQCLAKDERVSC
jgi:hypothetical protein